MRALVIGVMLLSGSALAQSETPAPSPEATPEVAATPAATPTPEATPAPAPPVPKWKGSLEAGATSTSGNTDVQTFTGGLKLDGTWRGWGVAARSSGVYAETEDVQTAGAWDANVRGDRMLRGLLGAYARLSIDGDRFKGFENRKGAGAGLSVAKKWKAPEGGYDRAGARAEVGYQYYLEDLVGIDVDNEVHAARAFTGVFGALSKDTILSEEAEVLYDFETDGRYLVTSVTALAVKLRGNVALKISETIKMDTEPPNKNPADPASPRFEKVDTLTAFALALSF